MMVLRTCTTCHDLGMVLGTGGRTRDGWNGTIDDMISYGMSIPVAERQLVLDYLATYPCPEIAGINPPSGCWMPKKLQNGVTGWDAKIEDMVLYGMKISPEERALVLDYLVTYLPP